jgi:hypothetical protein
MTLESCALDCAGFTYFGTEYGRECERHKHSTWSSSTKSKTQVTVVIHSVLVLQWHPPPIAALHVVVTQQRNAVQEIVFPYTKWGPELAHLQPPSLEEQRPPLQYQRNQLVQAHKRLAYLQDGFTLAVYSKFRLFHLSLVHGS